MMLTPDKVREPSMKKDLIRIGNAGGYWGDDPQALERQVNGRKLDYISIDFLAEITMSIMKKQKNMDPELGYARDFIPMLRPVLPKLLKNRTTLITNAGGINPESCARAIAALGKELGVEPKIAVVKGDDILDKIENLVSDKVTLNNMETGESFSQVKSRIEAANVYFGAAPVVEALKWNPDIVITGRVTDTGITLAPMIYEFGWSLSDWDKLAQGIVAGHILECGTQATGGNFTDWQQIPTFEMVGFPIVEVEPTGQFTVTKHENSGGLVSVDTIREQLFYEMGDPKSYITPDVIADFSSIRLSENGKNRVRVEGVKGFEPTELYKVSMAYEDGFKANGSIIISGPNAAQKAETFAKIFWHRCNKDQFEDTSTEFIGLNACHGNLAHSAESSEILLRLGVRAKSKTDVKRFAKQIPSLILSGPPGVAVISGVPKPQTVVSYWPALLPKKLIHPEIELYDNGSFINQKTITNTATGSFKASDQCDQISRLARISLKELKTEYEKADWYALERICLARSGDKGDTANIGVMARTPEAFVFLDQFLTADRIKSYFQDLCHGAVKRYRLENMLGFNFLLEESLGGGGTKTLRIDAQGKTFAQALLKQKAPISAELLSKTAK